MVEEERIENTVAENIVAVVADDSLDGYIVDIDKSVQHLHPISYPKVSRKS